MDMANVDSATGFTLSASSAGRDDDTPIDERAMSKLRWRCRRGLLENDLFVARFFAAHPRVTGSQARGLLRLMDLSDNDLLDLLLRRVEPDRGRFVAESDDVADVSDADTVAVLNLMRAPVARLADGTVGGSRSA